MEVPLGAKISQKAATSNSKVTKNGAKQAPVPPHSDARAPFWRPSGAKAAPKARQSGAKAAFWRASAAEAAPKRQCWANSAPKDFKVHAAKALARARARASDRTRARARSLDIGRLRGSSDEIRVVHIVKHNSGVNFRVKSPQIGILSVFSVDCERYVQQALGIL